MTRIPIDHDDDADADYNSKKLLGRAFRYRRGTSPLLVLSLLMIIIIIQSSTWIIIHHSVVCETNSVISHDTRHELAGSANSQQEVRYQMKQIPVRPANWMADARMAHMNIQSNVSGMLRMCIEDEPDGGGLIETEQGDFLLLFKADHFWVIKFEAFLHALETGTALISAKNAHRSAESWANFPDSILQVITFTGLPRTDSFYNNVFVYSETQLIRYQVGTSVGSHLNVTYLGTYKTIFTEHFSNFDDYQFIVTIPGTRVIFVKPTYQTRKYPYLYSFNELNIENPVQYLETDDRLVYANQGYPFASFILKGKNALTFSATGDVCYGLSLCKNFRQMMFCDPRIEAFIESWAYWLWRETSLTIRLVIIALCSVMIINFILGVSFIAHQVHRISELT